MTALRLVAFDLDDTVWYPEMYMLDGPPFRKDESGKVFDSRGTEIKLIPGARQVLEELHRQYPHIQIAWASRTEYPEWAFKCLELFTINGVSLRELGTYEAIYPGDKKTHFRAFQKQSGFAFEEMAFFDNEKRNCTSVSTLKVACYYTPRGMESSYWLQCKAAFGLSDK